ncbi:MAG: hypothetical protein ACRDXX_15110 [Stackebrandtia sp.]
MSKNLSRRRARVVAAVIAAAATLFGASQLAFADTESEADAPWVSGTVHDGASHGWPLYATLSVEGIEDPIVTNLRGEFREQVPEGRHAVVVESLYAGYQALETEMTVHGDDVTFGFELPLSEENCKAPGYQTGDDGECEAVEGGMVVGFVTDDVDPEWPIPHATVEDAVSKVAVQSRYDSNFGRAIYTMFTPVTGTHEFEVRHEEWETESADIEVIADEVVGQDFWMTHK